MGMPAQPMMGQPIMGMPQQQPMPGMTVNMGMPQQQMPGMSMNMGMPQQQPMPGMSVNMGMPSMSVNMGMGGGMMLDNANVLIVSVSDGRALDCNTAACGQLSPQHPRPFLWQPTPGAPNHRWSLRPCGNGNYMIVGSNGMALDGNTGVPQEDQQHPKPFLWQPTPGAPNHQWRFQATGQPNVYNIVNASNNMALDSNVSATRHMSFQHPQPFLWQCVPTAPNHQWRVQF